LEKNNQKGGISMSEKKKKRGLLFCVCLGTCPSFKDTNEYEVLNALRREKLVDWVGLHPQLCSTDGDEYLKALLNGNDIDELYVAGCDPVMQKKMFRDAFDAAGFSRDKHIGIEVRNMKTEEVIDTIKKAIQERDK